MLDFAMDKMPAEKFGYNYFVFGIIDSYYKAGATSLEPTVLPQKPLTRTPNKTWTS